jgi:hypothetical protein
MAITYQRVLPTSGTLGANGQTFSTSFDATGCDCVVALVSIGSEGVNTAGTSSSATYAGAAMTKSLGAIYTDGNTSAGVIFTKLSPASGSNTLAITTDVPGGNPLLAVVIIGYSGVASIGNTASSSPVGGTSDSPTLNLNCASGNVGVGLTLHGGTIDSVDQTSRAINNYSGMTSGSCIAGIENAGVGANTPVSANSGINDFWNLLAVELVAAGSGAGKLASILGRFTPGTVQASNVRR